jgi:hypothetical protein
MNPAVAKRANSQKLDCWLNVLESYTRPQVPTIRSASEIDFAIGFRGPHLVTMQASKLSLMPEGLEEGLISRDLADLMDFIFADVQ